MAISYDQFKVVINDPSARARLGIALSDDDASLLSANEAQSIAYFETWHQGVSPLGSHAGHWHGPAIVGFIFSVVSLFGSIGYILSWFPIVAAFVGVVLAATSFGPIKIEGKRGRGLAIAALVIGLAVFAILVLQGVARTAAGY